MYRLVIVSLCFFSASVVQAELHEFRTPDGKSVQAEIVDFNAKLGKVTLKRQGGKRVRVNPSVFIEVDQKYIKEWASLAGFRSESLFKISCEDKLVEKWTEPVMQSINYGGEMVKETVAEKKYKRLLFDVNLENKNGVPLENLQFEYRIFYEQEEQPQPGKIVVKKKVESGVLKTVQLASKGKKTLTTKSVVLCNTEYSGDIPWDGGISGEKASGELKGIWLRIFCTTESGQMVTRNVYQPSSLEGKYSWK